MPPRLTWTDLPGRRVGVWGLGVEGRAATQKLLAMGVDPLLVDDRPSDASFGGIPVQSSAAGGLDSLARCDVVVAGPGISRYRPEVVGLQESGVAVVGGLALWLEEAPRDRVVCVTGTKGKSTTVAILGALLGGLGKTCFTGGNLGTPPFSPEAPASVDYWIIEVSSFQSASLTCAPPVVAVTSLFPDHLDWHENVDNYYRDKLSVCRQPGSRLSVVSGADDVLAEHRYLLGDEVAWVVAAEETPAWIERLGLRGRFNQINALIAQTCLVEAGVAEARDPAALLGAAGSFQPLQSRLRTVGHIGRVEFVDDSLSTNVLPTAAALDALAPRRTAVLVGGMDRGIDYSPLADRLAALSNPVLVATMPQNGARVGRRLREAGLPEHVEVVDCASLEEAVRDAYRWARPEGVVLLSPAAPSFGLFRNYQDRAEQFVRICTTLGRFKAAD